ncbi:MAG: gliding motility-associated ABC transporter substrate-binding protein GldG [Bacteroidales bacterium]|nr:gliding motility-associated ABC transporter substrate-binding protein GldG [Bacteroidales bacterium]MCF8405575.1 gliding motility-associated ABC transporter substrate-binding protein GldG [Bacteroidales bacterium]
MEKVKKDIKRSNIAQLLMGVVIIILINIIGSFLFTRIDLTAEKRYTLSEQTIKMLKGLDDNVYFQVYLDGDFPAGFKRLQRETREMLDQFRAYSDNIQYEFINPSESGDERERNSVYQRLVERGLNPTDLQVKTNDGSSQQIIFPGAIVSFRNTEMPIELLVAQMGLPPEEVLNNSIQNLEFNIASTIQKLSVTNKPKVAFIEGHGELSLLETADIIRALQDYYAVERIKINGKLNSLTNREDVEGIIAVRNKFDAIIIAKPDSVFNEKDKFIIDQFIMRGGKVLWLIDPVFASMDSIQFSDNTVGIINELNLDDQLFKYGVRLNTNLVMDLNALPIPLKTGEVGGAPQIDFFPWYYFPVLNPKSEHPIVKNLNAIKTEFISSIDTIKTPTIKKVILLTSSKYARVKNTPVFISLEILQQEPDKRLFNMPDIPVAVLLEGSFESSFTNRVPPEIRESEEISFVENGRNTKMIVVADGDIIKNQVRMSEGREIPYPLGYDRYTGQTFGNREFILNAMNYLVDDEGLISIRSRELKLRMLDRTKIAEHRVLWQILNTILPVVLLFIIGVILTIKRRRKYLRN